MRIKYPISIDHTIEIDLSERFDIDSDRGTISNDALRFNYAYSRQNSKTILEYSLKTFADSVPVEKIPQHLLVLDRIHQQVGFQLTRGGGVGYARRRTNRTVEVAVGVVMIVGLLVLVCVVFIRDRLKGRSTQVGNTGKVRVGFGPDSPINVRNETEINAALRAFRCSCSQTPYQQDSPPTLERFTYDGELLIGTRLSCSSCLRVNDLYFKLSRSQPDQALSPQTDY